MSLFQARRKPKRVAREEADPAQNEDDDSGPVVRRPGAVKQKSRLRVSFDPSNEDTNDSSSAVPSESEPSSVVRPIKRHTAPSLQDRLTQISRREEDEAPARPTYSKTALDELRASTPSTPKDHLSLSLTTTPDPEDNLALSIESKFGKLPASTSTAIPSATEISERKARRARLALEQSALPASTTDPNSEDYIPLDAYDSDGEFKPQRMQVGTWHQPTKEPESRLIHDDEDIAEGFDEFTEPTTLAQERSARHSSSASRRTRNRLTTDSLNLTSRSARRNAEAERSAMRAAIDAAENNSGGGSDSDNGNDSDSDADSNASASTTSSTDRTRRHAYELSQTAHALPSSLSNPYLQAHRRPKQPKEMIPVPKLSAGLASLRERVEAIGLEKERLRRRLREVEVEKREVRGRLEFVQRSLEEGGRRLEGFLREEEGAGGGEGQTNGQVGGSATVGVAAPAAQAQQQQQQQQQTEESRLETIGSGLSRPPADELDN